MAFLTVASAQSQAEDFAYTNISGAVTITGYSGPGGDVTIPSTLNGLPVTTVAAQAFADNTTLARVTIPDSVTTLADGPLDYGGCLGAFVGCRNLTNVVVGKGLTFLGVGTFNGCTKLLSVYFQGNAPVEGTYIIFDMGPFWGAASASLYYLPGTTGWLSSSFEGRPEILWNPRAVTGDTSFGLKQTGFGFNIAGTPAIPLVVEASTTFTGESWVPLQNCTLTNGLIYFSDPQWTNYPERSYRIRSP